MTVRRRFFPAQRVQRTPGQTVKVDMQLHPLVKVPEPVVAGDCQCDVVGPAWLGDWYSWDWVNPEDPDRLIEWSNGGYGGPGLGKDFPAEGMTLGGRVVGQYVPIQNEMPVLYRGVLVGRTLCNVQWTWTLDTPPLEPMVEEGSTWYPWWDGVEVTDVSGTLLVHVLTGYDYPWSAAPWWATLRATATCGGEPVGALELRMGWNFWNTEAGLPPFEL